MKSARTPLYIHALKYHALTRFCDGVVHLTTRETVLKTALVSHADPQAGDNQLKVG